MRSLVQEEKRISSAQRTVLSCALPSRGRPHTVRGLVRSSCSTSSASSSSVCVHWSYAGASGTVDTTNSSVAESEWSPVFTRSARRSSAMVAPTPIRRPHPPTRITLSHHPPRLANQLVYRQAGGLLPGIPYVGFN